MPDPIQIRMGGYGPATTGFSRALKFIGDRLNTEFGDRVEVKYVWNIMELGYRADDILWLVANRSLERFRAVLCPAPPRIAQFPLLPHTAETLGVADAGEHGALDPGVLREPSRSRVHREILSAGCGRVSPARGRSRCARAADRAVAHARCATLVPAQLRPHPL